MNAKDNNNHESHRQGKKTKELNTRDFINEFNLAA